METFEPATANHGKWREYLAGIKAIGGTKEDAQGAWAYLQRCVHFRSETYQVAVDKTPEHGFGDQFEIWHLSFKRNDREAFHDWRVAQDLKNQICGPETEGIELYPAESRLVDTSNQYHLWVFMNYTLPLGWTTRTVMEESDLPGFAPNAKQRPRGGAVCGCGAEATTTDSHGFPSCATCREGLEQLERKMRDV